MGVLKEASRFFGDVGKQFTSSKGVQGFMDKVTKETSAFVGTGGEGKFGQAFAKGLTKIHSDAGLTGAAYGAAAGGIGGIASSDRDVGFFRGAAMGGVSGYRAMTGGIGANTAKGAVMGGLYGAISDDTSIMGGAFMGAAAGGLGGKYASGFNRARKLKVPQYKTNKTGLREKTGKMGSAGIFRAGRATAKAVRRDVGRHWRGQRTRASKNTATMGSNSGL